MAKFGSDASPVLFSRWRSLGRFQLALAILALVMAMGFEAIRLGPIRETLIRHHDEAAFQLESVASHLEKLCRPCSTDQFESNRKRAQAYRKLARWYRWQAWRYRLPLMTSGEQYRGLNSAEIDTNEWIKKLKYMERIERSLGPSEKARSQ